VVLQEIPPFCTAVGVPAKVVRQHGRKVADDVDQIHIPDPVAQELARLQSQLDDLAARLEGRD
jgi:serine O-acetyltransferase